jgi:predicted nicotinamide N-methyase
VIPEAHGGALVEEAVVVAGRQLRLLRPPDAEALLDEEAFEREEFLPYWAELWPSSLRLAEALAGRPLAGVRVLELGCGLGLPAIVAALEGAHVLATDWSADAVEVAALNAARNGAVLETGQVSWADPGGLVARGAWPLVVASDVLYERRNVEELLGLLPRLTEPEGSVLVSDPGRPHLRAFLEGAAGRWEVTPPAEPGPRGAGVYELRRK